MAVKIMEIVSESPNFYVLKIKSSFGEELTYLPKKWKRKPKAGKVVSWEWLDHK